MTDIKQAKVDARQMQRDIAGLVREKIMEFKNKYPDMNLGIKVDKEPMQGHNQNEHYCSAHISIS